MSRIAFAAVALTAAGYTVSAQAADLYGSRPYPNYTVNRVLDDCSWAGPYLGGNIGYAWGSVDNNPTKPSGFVGGVQAGYNWQSSPSSPWVFGVEGDIQATGADDTFAPWKFSNPWFGTVRGRAGYAFVNNFLVYATGGLAFGELRAETFGLSETHTNAGWTAGVGGEFEGRISLRRSGEQQFHRYGRLERLPFRRAARRHQLSFLIANKEDARSQPPGRFAAGIFYDETTRLTALGPLPFLSGSTSNVMRWPSARSFSPARSTAVM